MLFHTCPLASIAICYCHAFCYTQDRVDVGTATRQSHLHGVAFPIDQNALQALQQLGNKELAYVRLVSSLLRFSGDVAVVTSFREYLKKNLCR